MPEQVKKAPCCTALLAHVDAGKTTLSEALLYESGARRVLGRVDHRDSYLDTHSLERARGITIFSKQAMLETEHREITLVDTPGHVDFSAEAERTMQVLDCAVLVISGTDGVQAQTRTQGLYAADGSMAIKKSNENPLVDVFYNGYFKGKAHELLHNHHE